MNTACTLLFDGNAAVVYSYLTKDAFQPLKGRYLQVNKLSFLNKNMEKTLRSVPMTRTGNEYKLNMALDQLFQPNELNFTGRVFLLIDRSTFSTATLFTSIFHNHDRGMILGNASGGGYRGDSGGLSMWNCLIPVSMSSFHWCGMSIGMIKRKGRTPLFLIL